jgi:ubiquitin C-terminal hydrolase
MSCQYNIVPLGLPNIGASCWLNSILQVFNRSPSFLETIYENGPKQGPFHEHLIELCDAIKARDTNLIVEKYRKCHAFIMAMHPVFAESSLNDSHEVLTYCINKLHEEAARDVPQDIMDQAPDGASCAILKDFKNQ